MRTIPASLQAKLLNRFKAVDTGTEPHIRLVATQMSTNTLLSEPIHKDVTPDYGDVAIRQMEGDEEPYCAYAICVDEGIAKIYRRMFPANMEFVWEYVWTFGPVEDVAMEYDGIWTVDPSNTWYYLQTQEFPYVFTVENGDLYCQYWNDSDTRFLLAEDVEQISACKGWKNSIDIDLDQGLIIGYIRDGEVFYRALCTQDDGRLVWETEHQVTSLGQDNETLSVIRTNDFRIGFLTEKDGEIFLAMSKRNYAGMSVRPEAAHITVRPELEFLALKENYGYARDESLSVSMPYVYLNFDNPVEAPEISMTRAEKINREDSFYAYGCRLYLDKPLHGDVPVSFKNVTEVSYYDGSRTVTVAVSGVSYDSELQAIVLMFASDIRRTYAITVNTPSSPALWYYRLPGQKWYVPEFTATLEPETYNYYVYEKEYISIAPAVSLGIETITDHEGLTREAATIAVVPAFTLEPSSILPI